MSSNKLSLKWEEFGNNAASSFQALFKDTDFTDVTLASSDGQTVGAHKVVLSSCSPVLKSMLFKNSHPSPLLYLRGVKLSQLETIIAFCYLGQAEVLHSDLEDFLEVARDLGLSQEDTQGQNQENVQKNRRQNICKYWNRGFCKSKRKCLWDHPTGDCKEYMQFGTCRDRTCSKRHRQVCRYWLEEGCTRKKECQFLHADVGQEYYTSSLSISNLEKEASENRSHKKSRKKSENEENKTIKVSKGSISDLESTFDFALLEISDTEINREEFEIDTTDNTDNYFQCKQCHYKCKCKKAFQKHINTKHNDKVL